MAGGLCLALRKTGFLSAQPQMPSPGPPSPPRSGRSQAGGGSAAISFSSTRRWLWAFAGSESRATEPDRAAPLSVTGSPAEEENHHHFRYIASESLEQRSPFVSRPRGPAPCTTLRGFSPVTLMPSSGVVAVILFRTGGNRDSVGKAVSSELMPAGQARTWNPEPGLSGSRICTLTVLCD